MPEELIQHKSLTQPSNSSRLSSHLGVGPMSSEIIEAVFRYSHFHRTQMMLIASKNQIDYNGGYVNGWITSEFKEFIDQMRSQYEFSDVKLCRDHCGPGFNRNFDLQDTYNTIKDDIKNGFDLIHIDFCHYQGDMKSQLEASRKAIEYCLGLNPNVLIEIGTDENIGAQFEVNNLLEIEDEIEFFRGFCQPEFYVIQTGSLVKGLGQVGNFNQEFVQKAVNLVHERGWKLKEHNADYLTKNEIIKRRDIVDAMNIAPQLGVIQTNLVLNRCLVYGIAFHEFLNVVYNGQNWKKWQQYNGTVSSKYYCTQVAGHYHFNSDVYRRIIDELGQCEDIKESIINLIMEVIDHYGNSE